jgi:hypothetical protein
MFKYDKYITNSLIITKYIVKKSFGPMIADQEKITGVFDLHFNYLPF